MLQKSSAHALLPGGAEKAWWQRPYRMIQTNLRQPDANYDQRRLAQEVKALGANVLLYNVGGIYAFYPTRLSLQAINPLMKGDALGSAIAAAREENLVIVGRFDMSKATRVAYEAHPEWFVHNAKGEALTYNGTYQACVNGGWYQDYSLEIISEVLKRYDIDGLFFNWFGYLNYTYSKEYFGICTCERCRSRFRSMYGMDLPKVENFSDPAYGAYLQFKDRTADELRTRIYHHIKQLRPDLAVTGERGASDLIRTEIQRVVSRRPPEWPYQSGELARWGRAYGRGKTVSATSTNFIDYAWRFASETGACHLLRFAQQLANGATLDYYLLGTTAQEDARPFRQIAELFHWHGRNEAYYTGLRSGSKVALYDSRKTGVFRRKTATAEVEGAPYRGAFRALLEGRIPFDFVCDEVLEKPDGAASLDAYESILMPNAACLSEMEAQALDAWVEAGGVLIATGESGFYDEVGDLRDAPALSCLPVSKRLHIRKDMKGSYFTGTPDELTADNSGLVMLDRYYIVCDVKDDASGLLTLRPPQRFGPPELCFHDMDGSLPGILVRDHGKGKAIYLPWFPDWQYFRDGLPGIRSLLVDLVSRFIDPAPVVVRGRGAIELTIQKQPATGRTLIHVVNYSGQRNNLYEDPCLLHDLTLGVRKLSGVARALVRGVDLPPLSDTPDDQGYIWYALPPVDTFEAISFEAS